MILVDSSVWVDFFRKQPGGAGSELRRMIQDSEPLALTGIVITEVLQGLTHDARVIERLLIQFDVLEPRGFGTYFAAGAIFRAARVKGIALTTIDTLVAAIALEYNASLFTLGREFSRMALMTGLVLHRF